MDILDEGVIQKVTYSPECQATFKKYKSELLQKVIIYSIVLIFLVVIIPIAYNFFSANPQEGTAPVFWLFIGGIIGFIWIGAILQQAIKDLMSKKLDITKDVFLNIKKHYPKSSNNNNNSNGFYVVELKNAGTLEIPPHRIRRIEKDTEVYVVRTDVSKTLLDIIPIDMV